MRWSFDDSYIDFNSEIFTSSFENLKAQNENLVNFLNNSELTKAIISYEEAYKEATSLLAFCRCKSSDNTKDELASKFELKIKEQKAKLDTAKEILFDKFDSLKNDDKIFQSTQFKHIKFLYLEHKNSKSKIRKKSERDFFANLALTNFFPLFANFRHLNNLINISATNKNANTQSYNLAKCMGILKGSDDEILRKNVFDALSSHYDKFSDLYLDILNMLHGFRLAKFKAAKVDFLTPSLEENKMSLDTLNAMQEAISKRVEKIRECVRVRASFLGGKSMRSCDLLAPYPLSKHHEISHDEAIKIIKKVLKPLGEDSFIELMIDKHWIESDVRENKAGGAFFVSLPKFKQPRIFTTYMNTLSHLIQQAHELGHAWHYYLMRDLPVLSSNFPMSLAESASTFNETLLRNELKKDGSLKVEILWQELKSAANFLLHINVRYEFETGFIKLRQKGQVSKKDANDLLKQAWNKFYKDSTSDVEEFLPYFKPHFYKTDNYIYNYPYSVGYLLSQFFLSEFKKDEAKFCKIYKQFLIECGTKSVEELMKKHFKKDTTKYEFWLIGIDEALKNLDEFKKVVAV